LRRNNRNRDSVNFNNTVHFKTGFEMFYVKYTLLKCFKELKFYTFTKVIKSLKIG